VIQNEGNGRLKEERMKKLIVLILFLMMVSIVIGCAATMTSEERRETYELRSVGESPFVGGSSPEARALVGRCGTVW
jgi:hypothetical protein